MKKGTFIPVPTRPRISEGTYKGKIVSWHQFFSHGQKIFINTEVVDNNGEVINLSFIANIKLTEEGLMIAPKRSSKLSKMLSALIPTVAMNDVDLDALIGLQCLCRVEDSKLDSHKKTKPEKDWYSTITEMYPLEDQRYEFLDDD